MEQAIDDLVVSVGALVVDEFGHLGRSWPARPTRSRLRRRIKVCRAASRRPLEWRRVVAKPSQDEVVDRVPGPGPSMVGTRRPRGG